MERKGDKEDKGSKGWHVGRKEKWRERIREE